MLEIFISTMGWNEDVVDDDDDATDNNNHDSFEADEY